MARSYNRRARRGQGGLLVREAAVQRGVRTNSLYSVPTRGTGGSPSAASSLAQVTSTTALTIGGKSFTRTTTTGVISNANLGNFVRVSSVTVSSKSPCLLQILNTSGGYSDYMIPGQKTVKVPLGDKAVLGNPVGLRSFLASVSPSQSSPVNLIQLGATEDQVDWQINLVIDGDA